MADEHLRAELAYWRELELISGQRQHFKSGSQSLSEQSALLWWEGSCRSFVSTKPILTTHASRSRV